MLYILFVYSMITLSLLLLYSRDREFAKKKNTLDRGFFDPWTDHINRPDGKLTGEDALCINLWFAFFWPTRLILTIALFTGKFFALVFIPPDTDPIDAEIVDEELEHLPNEELEYSDEYKQLLKKQSEYPTFEEILEEKQQDKLDALQATRNTLAQNPPKRRTVKRKLKTAGK